MPSAILGTAQWGTSYGVTNLHGLPTDAEIREQVRIARGMPVTGLDTAADYGDAETRIASLGLGLPVQTKFRAGGLEAADVRHCVERAAARFGGDLQAVLVHDWSGLEPQQRHAVARALTACRAEGLVRFVGISAYEESDLAGLFSDGLPWTDVVQLPTSVLDQRLEESDDLGALRSAGVRVQVRSVFLQGLLLSDEGPDLAAHPDLVRFRRACAEAGRSRLQTALDFVKSRVWVDEVVLAATTPAELAAIVDAWKAPVSEWDWSSLASSDPDLVDPRRWNAARTAVR